MQTVLLAGLLGVARTGMGQEALRVSIAGQTAAEARQRAASTPGYYNLKAWDLRVRLQSSLQIEANDNVNLTEQDEQEDLILRPQIDTRLWWPVSDKNALNLNIGIGYSAYLINQELSRFFITPGTELSFDIYIEDCVVNLHDRLTLSEQAYQNPSVSGTGNYGYFENASGLSATWDLNELQLTVGYDHLVRISTTSDFDQENVSQDLFYGNGGFHLNPSTLVGVEFTAGLIAYEEDVLSGGVQYSAGVFYRMQLSEYITLRATLGYFMYVLDDSGQTGTSSDINAVYGSLSASHRVNERMSYSLSAGRQVQVGLFSDTLDLYYARLQANWNVVREIPISTSLVYENGTESGGAGEKFQRVGGGVGLSRRITEKLGASLQYDVLSRYSDTPGRDYLQNRVLLSLAYSF